MSLLVSAVSDLRMSFTSFSTTSFSINKSAGAQGKQYVSFILPSVFVSSEREQRV